MPCHLKMFAATTFYCCIFSGVLKELLPQYNFLRQNLSVVSVPQKTVFPANQRDNILIVTGSKQDAGSYTITLS